MNKKDKVNFIINTLESLYAKVPIPLNHNDSYTLLIAVLLSAVVLLFKASLPIAVLLEPVSLVTIE